MSAPLLEGSPPQASDPVAIDAFLSGEGDDLSDLLARACDHHITATLRAWGVRHADFPSGLEKNRYTLVQSLRDGGCQTAEAVITDLVSLSRLRDRHLNAHVRREASMRPRELLTASISHVQGVSHGGHSDLVSVSSEMILLRISRAVEEENCGNRRTRETVRIAEVEMTPEDLVLLLRGRPEGGSVRCNLMRLLGRGVEQAPYMNAFKAEVEASASIDGEAADILDAWTRIHDRVCAGVTRKSDRDEILRLLDVIEDKLPKAVEDRCREVREKAGYLEDLDRSLLRQALSDMGGEEISDLLSGEGPRRARIAPSTS